MSAGSSKKQKQKYHYLYKITNKTNNYIYIGVHTTVNLDDGYMGSGYNLKKAIEKEGIENFEKTILEYFNSDKEMYAREAEIVDIDFISRPDTYNIVLGGDGGFKGNSPERSRKLSVALKGKVTAFDTWTGEYIKIPKPEFDANRDRYYGTTKYRHNKPTRKGYATVKDSEGNIYSLPVDDPRILSGEFHGVSYGTKQTLESNLRRS